ncbi:MAG: sugar ABC transporter ATP-binding protein [Sulfitobacter dubius]
MREPLLQITGLSKAYGPVKALTHVDFSLERGTVHALVGENGAGKSTLIKVIVGAEEPDRPGVLRVYGQPIKTHSPRLARHLGIAAIHQELSLADNLTVAENMLLGQEVAKIGWVLRQATQARCAKVLSRLTQDFACTARLGDLSLAQRYLVEIARALIADARVLILDEPTTALSHREADALMEIVKQLRDDGVGIVYVTHRMEEIYRLADYVTVLRDGRSIARLDRAEVTERRVLELMVGRDPSNFFKRQRRAENGPIVLEAKGLAGPELLRDGTVTVRAGEVVGLAGLVGSGRTELAECLVGYRRATAGEVRLFGTPIQPAGVARSAKAGLVYLTEDRRKLGLFPDMSVADNINVLTTRADARLGWLRRRGRESVRAQRTIQALAIRASGPDQSVRRLSGGNQQKTMLARLLESAPKVVLLDEPTRGVDVGAKAQIYGIIEDFVKGGGAVLMISSDLPELLGVADRILVCYEGRIVGGMANTTDAPATEAQVIALATGMTEAAA